MLCGGVGVCEVVVGHPSREHDVETSGAAGMSTPRAQSNAHALSLCNLQSVQLHCSELHWLRCALCRACTLRNHCCIVNLVNSHCLSSFKTVIVLFSEDLSGY